MNTPADPTSSVPASDTPASPSGGDTPEQRAARIRIGTQRYGAKAPKAVAHPVLQAPPRAPQAPAVGGSDAETTRQESAVDTALVESTAPAAEQAPAGAAAPAPPRREKRRAEQPLNVPAPRKYPPPNIRGQLSPDLELEYLEALGGQSIDEVIASETPAPVAELELDTRHQGKVLAIHRDDVFVEIGGRQQGIVSLRSFREPPEIGAQIEIVVNRFNSADGVYELTLPGAAVDVGDWSDVAEGMVVDARVTGHNKGGLECEVNHLRGFIPASQVSMYRVENLEQFVGQTLRSVISEANPEKRNLVLSHRAVLEREKAEAKEKLMQSLEVGQLREGTVRSLQDFGAFVDLGGVDGLVHISQISWDRIKHPSEVLEVGQKVRVKIQKIDPPSGKISLALRDLTESPWATASHDFPVKTRVSGRVTRLTEFGAFVRLGPGVEGLVHISELSHKRVFRVSDVLAEGQEVEVLVLSVDAEAQRISLSLKALEARPTTDKEKAAEEAAEPETPPTPPKKRKTPLRGGIGGPPSGEQFGLKW